MSTVTNKTPSPKHLLNEILPVNFCTRVINKLKIGLAFVFFILTNLSSQKRCNHISTAWYESVLEKENENVCQVFASQNPLLKKLTYKKLLSILIDST